MKPISAALLPAFKDRLKRASVPVRAEGAYQKWLRYYLDFCFRYKHPPRDPDSLQPFLQKLASKNQPKGAQEEAAHSVALYYEAVKDWSASTAPGTPAGLLHPPRATDAIGRPAPSELAWDEVYRKLKEEIRLRQYSPKTWAAYRTWTEQFQRFLKDKPPAAVMSDDAVRYLTYLATEQKVVSSTQNQAFNALLFLYRHILKTDYDLADRVVRARRTRYIPVVLTREEVDSVIGLLEYPHDLIAGLLYGCGLRLFEALNLRVGCLNFGSRVLTVHDGKGKKDRTVPLPEVMIPDLKAHMDRVGTLHEKDLASGYHGVFMPGALDRKWKNACRELIWQWLFPARSLTFVPGANEHRRYHVHESVFQKALHAAVRRARIPKRVTAHTFRHTFASHLLVANYDIRTIQQLLGHSDLRTTMIYTHTVKSRTLKEVGSPLDFTREQIQMANQL